MRFSRNHSHLDIAINWTNTFCVQLSLRYFLLAFTFFLQNTFFIYAQQLDRLTKKVLLLYCWINEKRTFQYTAAYHACWSTFPLPHSIFKGIQYHIITNSPNKRVRRSYIEECLYFPVLIIRILRFKLSTTALKQDLIIT